MWRTEELARTALACLERKEFAAGGLLTRGVTESAAAVWYLRDLIERQTENLNAVELDKKAMALLLGHRLKDAIDTGTPVAINVLSMIDKVDKEVPGFRKSCDALSETAHPNWRGTAGLFSKIDSDQILTLRAQHTGHRLVRSPGPWSLSGLTPNVRDRIQSDKRVDA